MTWRVIVLTIALLLFGSTAASARYTSADTLGANAFAAATLAPATGLAAVNAGANGITLSWTHSTSSFEDGYNVLRGTVSGGPYTQVGTTGATTNTYTDPVAAGTYFYVVQATGRGWTSANSTQANGTSTIANTGFLACSANLATTTGAGDNNGFQTNPAAGCTNTTTLATDTSTGTGTTDVCTGATKDRHQYYNFGASIAAGKTIDGIEIRAALSENNTTGTTRVCAELSWNAGTSWTAAKSVLLTTTAETTFTYGGAADVWGRTWATTEFTNANFRLRLTNSATVTNKNILLRNLGLRVTYH